MTLEEDDIPEVMVCVVTMGVSTDRQPGTAIRGRKKLGVVSTFLETAPS